MFWPITVGGKTMSFLDLANYSNRYKLCAKVITDVRGGAPTVYRDLFVHVGNPFMLEDAFSLYQRKLDLTLRFMSSFERICPVTEDLRPYMAAYVVLLVSRPLLTGNGKPYQQSPLYPQLMLPRSEFIVITQTVLTNDELGAAEEVYELFKRQWQIPIETVQQPILTEITHTKSSVLRD